MKSTTRRTRLRVAAAASTLALAAAGCGGGDSGGGGTGGGGGQGGANEASDTGVTETTVKIGGHFPLTGPAAPGYSEIPTGHQCYYEYVNKNGGVNGRQIEWLFRDDAYNPTNATQVVNQLVLQDEVFAIVSGLGTPIHRAVLDFVNGEEVPDLFVSSGSLLWNQPEEYPMTFGWQPDYTIEGKILGQYVAQEFPDAKVGLLLQGDDFGEDGKKGVLQYLDKPGAPQVVGEATYVPGNTDTSPQVAQLQQSGADLVMVFGTPAYVATARLAALRLNYDPQWMVSNVGSDPQLLGGLLARFGGAEAGGDLLEGLITTEYIPGADNAEDPWIQLWTRVWDACTSKPADAQLTNFRAYGMSQAYTFVQALQAAGQNPTRAGIVEAVENQGAEFEGPAYAPFRYSPEKHLGISGMKVVQVRGGGQEDLTGVLVTDVEDEPIEEMTGEPAAPPQNGIPTVQPAG